uniref:phage tail protein n=1 Tax=Clostridium sp. 12(A) TaxID=1163671 RepID=UPI000466C320|nr:phage tail protein [Clostridium sp. 12(A)]
MGIDLTTLAAGKSYTDKVAEEIITSDQKENIQKLTSDGEGNKALFDDGTYKTVSGSASDYESLYNRPVINGVELVGNITSKQLGFSDAASTGSYNDLKDKPKIPTLISQLTNDSDFITISASNLMNYYSKMESYTKTEINSLIANLNSMTIEVIEILPSENISATTMYLQKEIDKNSYNQWLYINNEWANIGTTDIDLTNYYSKVETDSFLNNKVDKVSGYGLSQNNFSTDEKSKLAGLNNYTLPSASPNVLGGVKPDNSTTFVDSNGVLSAVGGTSEVIDDSVTSLSKTWSSTKISYDIAVVEELTNGISIAQKTVNTKGTKELLSQEYSFNLTPALTMGTANLTAINQTITLKDSILNYDMINIQLKVNTNTVKISYPIYTFKTSSIVFNNSEVLNFTNGSAMNVNKIQGTTTAGAWGSFSASFSFWFKDATHLFLFNASTPSTATDWANVVLSSVQGVNIENVTIDPVNYVNTTQGIEDTPVGSILPQMGKTSPKHYLTCDGQSYNITDYPYLSQHIKDQFGTFNFFGGDGTNTFAVPDLRDEFLRGYHGDKTEPLSGEIGIHQSGTQHINFLVDGNSRIYMDGEYGKYLSTQNPDNLIKSTVVRGWSNNGSVSNWAGGGNKLYTSRPTNTAVLYCIKYEPTYFMNINGLVDEVVLWEGNVGTTKATAVSNSISLKDSFTNYDKLGFLFTCTRSDGSLRPQYKEIYPSQIIECQNSTNINHSISLVWGYSNVIDYTDIQKTSTSHRLDLNQYQSRLDKVIGIRYRSTSSTGGGDDTTYTDSEIKEFVEGILNGN